MAVMAERFSHPGTANISAADRARLAPLLKHYGAQAKPFTACYRDQLKHGLSPDHAARRCAVLKDLIHGGTGWRKGSRSLAAESVDVLSVVELAAPPKEGAKVEGQGKRPPGKVVGSRGGKLVTVRITKGPRKGQTVQAYMGKGGKWTEVKNPGKTSAHGEAGLHRVGGNTYTDAKGRVFRRVGAGKDSRFALASKVDKVTPTGKGSKAKSPAKAKAPAAAKGAGGGSSQPAGKAVTAKAPSAPKASGGGSAGSGKTPSGKGAGKGSAPPSSPAATRATVAKFNKAHGQPATPTRKSAPVLVAIVKAALAKGAKMAPPRRKDPGKTKDHAAAGLHRIGKAGNVYVDREGKPWRRNAKGTFERGVSAKVPTAAKSKRPFLLKLDDGSAQIREGGPSGRVLKKIRTTKQRAVALAYNPLQPRAPKGAPASGQWVTIPGGNPSFKPHPKITVFHGSGHDIESFDRPASFSPDRETAAQYSEAGPAGGVYTVDLEVDSIADVADVREVGAEVGVDTDDLFDALYDEDLRAALASKGYQAVKADEGMEANIMTLPGARTKIVRRDPS